MLSIILAFLAMFVLVYCLTNNKVSGVIAGLAYSFSPYRIAHIIHPTLYRIETIPFFICFLFLLKKCKENEEVWNIIYWDKCLFHAVFLSSFAYVVVVYNDGYYGFMCAIIALLFLLYHKFKFKTILQFFLVSFILIIPFILRHKTYICERLNTIMTYRACWYDYFNVNVSSVPVENRLFIFPILYPLTLYGILHPKSRFWTLLLLVSFCLSINEPICPIFRASTRWGLIVLLCVCILSGYGIKRISDGKEKK